MSAYIIKKTKKTEVVSTENNKFSSLNASYAYIGLYIEWNKKFI